MNRVIKIGQELVPVSEELYREYNRMRRREWYMKWDIKVGCIQVDAVNEVVTFRPSKEDSIERLVKQGADFADPLLIEDIVCDQATLLVLQAAVAKLNQAEQALIKALYYKNRTVREVAREENVSHVAVVKRHQKVLDKLRKFFT